MRPTSFSVKSNTRLSAENAKDKSGPNTSKKSRINDELVSVIDRAWVSERVCNWAGRFPVVVHISFRK